MQEISNMLVLKCILAIMILSFGIGFCGHLLRQFYFLGKRLAIKSESITGIGKFKSGYVESFLDEKKINE